MKTRTFSIRRFTTAALIATGVAAGAIATTAAPANAWSGCEGYCINTVKVTQLLANKSTARLQFTTSVPANVTITVKPVVGSAVKTVNEPAGYRTNHDIWTSEVLSQGKGYVVAVKATDQNGKSYTDNVSITALSRTVKLTLKGIKITDDSDTGAGELRAGISVGGTTSTIFGETSISATKTLNYSKVFTAKNVDFAAKVAVEIQDNDIDWGEWCPGGTGFSFSSGSTSCMDWTTGSAKMSSMSSSPGSTNGTFEFSANGRIDFKAWGSYTTTVA
jgi:hypothetical protein